MKAKTQCNVCGWWSFSDNSVCPQCHKFKNAKPVRSKVQVPETQVSGSMCHHSSATSNGCPMCDLIARVSREGIVSMPDHNAVGLTCEYCDGLVIFIPSGPTTFHAIPECDRYLAADLGGYIERIMARISGLAS